jgi:tRNA-specific 2-thiouridylase
MKLDKNKVAVGLSGGVDSAATAYLLMEEGYEVIGITMYLFDVNDENGNPKRPDFIKDAEAVAKKLGIQHYVADMRNLFDEKVRAYFENEYLNGRTPNPCVVCNKFVKYGELINIAHGYGAYYLATGHYANVIYDDESDIYRVFSGMADRKDQTYVLCGLSQNQLKYLKLPIGKFESKAKVREIALNVLTEISEKKDSVGICFLPEGYKAYMTKKYPDKVRKGNFLDKEGSILGEHKGIVNYTIGQKRNMGINFDPPKFVVEINAEKNQVILGEDSDTYVKGFIGTDVNFTICEDLKQPLKAKVKVCQWGWFLDATIIPMKNKMVMVFFDKNERAVAPGQAAVFYHEDEMIGGAMIESIVR